MSPKNKSNQRTLVLIDYANLKAATRYLGKKIDLKILYEHFKKDVSIKEVSLYYGTDPRDPRSYGFITWLRKTGYDVVTKEVKYIKINLKDLIYNSQTNRIFSRFNNELNAKIEEGIKIISKENIPLYQQKCNLDIEIALDIFSGLEIYDSFILFSGDSDFESILKTARMKGKYVTIISLRKFTAGEVIRNSDSYLNLMSLSRKLPGLLY